MRLLTGSSLGWLQSRKNRYRYHLESLPSDNLKKDSTAVEASGRVSFRCFGLAMLISITSLGFTYCVGIKARKRRLAKLDDNEGQIMSDRPVPPCSNAVKDRLLHFRKRSLCRLADQFFQTLDAEHFIPFIEDLDEPIGVKNQAVAIGQVNLVRAFRRSRIGETTEDAALRIQSTEAAIRDQHCWRVPCGGKRYTTTAPNKTTCCHREVKAVGCYAIVYELVKASQ